MLFGIVSEQARAAPRSRPLPSAGSAVARGFVAHDRIAALIIAAITAAIVFAPRIKAGGLLVDDWALDSAVHFPRAQGFTSAWDALKNVVGQPETFLNINPNLHPKVCCDHTSELMRAPAIPLFGAGPMSEGPVPVPPSVYFSQWSGVYAVYPGNGQNPAKWKR